MLLFSAKVQVVQRFTIKLYHRIREVITVIYSPPFDKVHFTSSNAPPPWEVLIKMGQKSEYSLLNLCIQLPEFV